MHYRVSSLADIEGQSSMSLNSIDIAILLMLAEIVNLLVVKFCAFTYSIFSLVMSCQSCNVLYSCDS